MGQYLISHTIFDLISYLRNHLGSIFDCSFNILFVSYLRNHDGLISNIQFNIQFEELSWVNI